ncbi:MAG: hypothetical protein V2I43_01610 [Parvularcula sp.]|jgi:hypothetical protein|nr:hypothetical protein [Parvularcula sp.]
MNHALARFREPSTWAALAALTSIVSPAAGNFVPYLGEAFIGGFGAIAAGIAMLKKESGSVH